ncbi:hypothetical protein [Klebsiella pneumoniae IS46]|nr:hypothetical protein [Klebsiella pneumoniae IS46]CDL15150.1 hypothetical protein [Klebsiella pneumoniae IS46]CDL15209.1 hypothetical protein [Klebsiella pneumoniae IS46]CDL16209.1 hypothetical protein [Klebsiella pneumoniae IS46]
MNIFLSLIFYRRNLLPCKRKNHPARWFFEGSQELTLF